MEQDSKTTDAKRRHGAPRVYQDHGQKLAFVTGVFMAAKIMSSADPASNDFALSIFQSLFRYQGLESIEPSEFLREWEANHFTLFENDDLATDFVRKVFGREPVKGEA